MSIDSTASTGDYAPREPANRMEGDVLRRSRELFAEHGGFPVRTAIIEHEGEMAPVTLPRMGRGGDIILQAFKQYIAEKLPNVSGIALVMETWGVKLEIGQSRDNLPDLESLTPEQGRFEALTVVIEHREFPERCHLWQAFITRDAQGVPTLGPWLASDGDVGGQSVGLLPNLTGERAD